MGGRGDKREICFFHIPFCSLISSGKGQKKNRRIWEDTTGTEHDKSSEFCNDKFKPGSN